MELTLPAEAQYDPAAIGDFKKIMADPKLTPGQRAQAVIDLNERQAASNVKAFNERVERQSAADLDALKADKDFGGARVDKTRADAISAVKQFGGEELSKLATAAGLQNHPAWVKTFARIRAAVAEDTTGARLPNPGAVTDEPRPVPLTQTGKIADAYNRGAFKKK